MEFRPRPYNRPTSLVRSTGDQVVLWLESERGGRMATRLRPMTIRDAFRPPWFRRRNL